MNVKMTHRAARMLDVLSAKPTLILDANVWRTMKDQGFIVKKVRSALL